MSALLELAERCEQATGPDRELSGDIAETLGWRVWRRNDGKPWQSQTVEKGWFVMPNFTASLDAAMSLVPEGTIWEVGHKVNYPAAGREPSRANYAFVNVGVPGAVKSFDGKSFATPALALSAAALRACSAMGGA